MQQEVLTRLVGFIARTLVDNTEQVEIAPGPNGALELHVAPDDIGKVIGKDGRTAQAIRTVLTATGTKLGLRTHLNIAA